MICILIIGQIFSSASQQLASVKSARNLWNTFNEVVDNLKRYEGHYSGTSGQLVSGVKRFLNSAENSYNEATNSVYDWCDASVPLLERNLESLKKNKANADTFLHIFDSGISKLNYAAVMLSESSMDLNVASGKLETLGTQLGIDFRQKIQKLEQEEEEIRVAQLFSWINIWAGLITNVVAEAHSIPQLRNEMRQVNGIHQHLRSEVNSVSNTIDQTRDQIKREVVNLGDMRTNIKIAGTLRWPQLLRKLIENKVSNLIGQCRAYKTNHGRT